MLRRAVLAQEQDGLERVIAYGSKSLTDAERRYSTIEKECLAAVYFTEKYRHYLLGKNFTIITDHRPLQWLHNQKILLGDWADGV